MIVEMTLDRGCGLFEKKYRRLLATANQHGHEIVHSIVRGAVLKPERSKQVNDDKEPPRFKKDNMGSYEARVEVRTRSTAKTATGSRNGRSRQARSREESLPRRDSNSRIKIRSIGVKRSDLVNMNP